MRARTELFLWSIVADLFVDTGHVYASNASYRCGGEGWLVYASGSLYFRSVNFVDGTLCEQVSPETLQLTRVVKHHLAAARKYAHMCSDGRALFFVTVLDDRIHQLGVDVFAVPRTRFSSLARERNEVCLHELSVLLSTERAVFVCLPFHSSQDAMFVRSVTLPAGWTQFPSARCVVTCLTHRIPVST